MSIPLPAKAGVLYFAVVFAIAFALGTVRVLWLAPKVGARAAELAEMPLLFAFFVVAARQIVRRLAVPPVPGARLAMGAVGLMLALAIDFTMVLQLRGLSLEMYFETLDPVSGSAYYALLGIFAITPYFLGGRA